MQRLSTIQLAADRTVFGRDRTFAALVRTGLLATASDVGAKDRGLPLSCPPRAARRFSHGPPR
jgi:hypothetical protein